MCFCAITTTTAAVAFAHVGAVLFDAFKLLGIEVVDVPNPENIPYPGENTFRAGFKH